MMTLKNAIAENYSEQIRAIVNQLKKTSKKAISENAAFLVDAETAKVKYNGRIGEMFYLFPDKAPSQDIINAFNECSVYAEDVTFQMHLSHRGMTVIFDGKDLVIRKDREIFIDRLSKNNMLRIIQCAKEKSVIDWSNAKFYFFPYKSYYFFISDSFEINAGGGRNDLTNEKNWFSIPFTEDFDYKEIRQMCKDFAAKNPLEEDSLYEASISLDYIEPQNKPQTDIEPVLNTEPTQKKNSGCIAFFVILISSLLFF